MQETEPFCLRYYRATKTILIPHSQENKPGHTGGHDILPGQVIQEISCQQLGRAFRQTIGPTIHESAAHSTLQNLQRYFSDANHKKSINDFVPPKTDRKEAPIPPSNAIPSAYVLELARLR